jgi:hypothetical protein
MSQKKKEGFFYKKRAFPPFSNSLLHLVEAKNGEEKKALNLGELVRIGIWKFQVDGLSLLVLFNGVLF